MSTVYKGVLTSGRMVAIKKFNVEMEDTEATRSFQTEVGILGQIRHRNLVHILGCCSNLDLKVLVLEFMPNGTLERWLYGGHDHQLLNWQQRLNIATGVAHGLVYLHHECDVTKVVVHCDLKPSNILLDSDMEAHISDFGIAKLIRADGSGDAVTSTFRGSFGYIAPEYAFSRKVSIKGDTYSFGVILLEMITCKRPASDEFAEGMNLPKWANAMAFTGINKQLRITEFLDPALDVLDNINAATTTDHHQVRLQQISAIVNLALLCTDDLPENRPTMKEVSDSLLQIKGIASAGTSGLRSHIWPTLGKLAAAPESTSQTLANPQSCESL